MLILWNLSIGSSFFLVNWSFYFRFEILGHRMFIVAASSRLIDLRVNIRIFTGFKLISSCIFLLFINFLKIGIVLSWFILAIQKIVKTYFSAIHLSVHISSILVPNIF